MAAKITPKKTTSLWTTVSSYAGMLFHRDTPWTVKGILLVAILYLLSPYDLIPDWLVGLGLIDDLAIVSLLVGLAIRLVTRQSRFSSGEENDSV